VYCNCLLSSKPITPDCVVLLAQPDVPCIWYCRIGGDTQWTKHEYDIGTQAAIPEYDLPEEKVVICPIAACGGRFYFNGAPGRSSLDVIDFCPDPVFSSIPIDDTIDVSYEGGGAGVFLVESNDELYMVSLFFPVNISKPCPDVNLVPRALAAGPVCSGTAFISWILAGISCRSSM
jgi:hypothetical protein